MATPATNSMSELLTAIATLPTYEVERLDAASEVEHFNECLTNLVKSPGFKTAEATCLASQRVLYALDECKWREPSRRYEQSLLKAEKLLGKVASIRGEAINSARASELERLNIFFDNIAHRHQELTREVGER